MESKRSRGGCDGEEMVRKALQQEESKLPDRAAGPIPVHLPYRRPDSDLIQRLAVRVEFEASLPRVCTATHKLAWLSLAIHFTHFPLAELQTALRPLLIDSCQS